MLTFRGDRTRDERHPADRIAWLEAQNEALRRELARLRGDIAAALLDPRASLLVELARAVGGRSPHV